jgi:pSer/pThr/pTyr-binding forkhead associated (FHA) protein
MLEPLNSGLCSYKLSHSIVGIGRASTCDIQINCKQLSAKHCQLEKLEDKIILTDFSSNGTYLGSDMVGKGNSIEVEDNS